jgi:hypothetical protein
LLSAGIKVALPCQMATQMSFLELYCHYILAFQVSTAHAAVLGGRGPSSCE